MTNDQVNYLNYQEAARHNLASETETSRSNLAQESETRRHNLTSEGITNRSLQETIRTNKANEKIKRNTLKETKRSNKAREAETHRSNVVNENEANRHNLATEANQIYTADRAYAGHVDSARISAEASKYIADMNYLTSTTVAGMNAASAANVAGINAVSAAGVAASNLQGVRETNQTRRETNTVGIIYDLVNGIFGSNPSDTTSTKIDNAVDAVTSPTTNPDGSTISIMDLINKIGGSKSGKQKIETPNKTPRG